VGEDRFNVPGRAGAEPLAPASLSPTGPILPQNRDFPTPAADQFQPVFHRGRGKIMPVGFTLRSEKVTIRLFTEKYFQVQRRVFQGTKLRRARLTRHSWCVRRTLCSGFIFSSPDRYKAGKFLRRRVESLNLRTYSSIFPVQ
jgi:hypothetical protein